MASVAAPNHVNHQQEKYMKPESITIKNLEMAFAGESVMAHINYAVFREGLPRGRAKIHKNRHKVFEETAAQEVNTRSAISTCSSSARWNDAGQSTGNGESRAKRFTGTPKCIRISATSPSRKAMPMQSSRNGRAIEESKEHARDSGDPRQGGQTLSPRWPKWRNATRTSIARRWRKSRPNRIQSGDST